MSVVRAYMAASHGRGAYLPQRHIGTLERWGQTWEVWETTGNALSSIVRFAPVAGNPARRCRYTYDPGRHMRSTYLYSATPAAEVAA